MKKKFNCLMLTSTLVCNSWVMIMDFKIFDTPVNPISTRLCPPQYYQPPQIFRPCDGPVQALQILTNDDEVENWSLSSFLLAVFIIEISYYFTTVYYGVVVSSLNSQQAFRVQIPSAPFHYKKLYLKLQRYIVLKT